MGDGKSRNLPCPSSDDARDRTSCGNFLFAERASGRRISYRYGRSSRVGYQPTKIAERDNRRRANGLTLRAASEPPHSFRADGKAGTANVNGCGCYAETSSSRAPPEIAFASEARAGQENPGSTPTLGNSF